MPNILAKIFGAFVTTEEYEDDYETFEDEYEEQFEEEEPSIRIVRNNAEQEDFSPIIEKPMRSDCKHVDFTPYSFDDMAYVVDTLRAGKAVILHLQGLEESFCQRVLDFASGAVCSLRCISDMPSNDICILIPDGMDASSVL